MADQAPEGAPAAPEYTPPATQADLDRIISERLARVKAKEPEDYKDLKAKAAKFDEIEAANKSELERATAKISELTARAEQAEQAAKLSKIHAAVLAEAAKAGAVDPEAVLALLSNDAVTIDDAGQVTGADTAVKALLQAKPYLVAQQAPPAPPGFPDLGQGSRGGDLPLNGDPILQSVRSRLGITA